MLLKIKRVAVPFIAVRSCSSGWILCLPVFKYHLTCHPSSSRGLDVTPSPLVRGARAAIFSLTLHERLSLRLNALGTRDAWHLQLQMSQWGAYRRDLKAAFNQATWKQSTLREIKKETLQIYQKKLAAAQSSYRGVPCSAGAHRALLWPLEQVQLMSVYLECF